MSISVIFTMYVEMNTFGRIIFFVISYAYPRIYGEHDR